MDKKTKVKVTNKWYGDLATLYSIRNLEDESLDPVLLFYSNGSVPNFTKTKK